MNTINRRRTQLSVVAVAALAIFALAAVMLLAGGSPAQATTAALTPDDGAALQRPQQTDKTPTPPRHNPPEACPGETGNPHKEAAGVVKSGHIALFDVWWNPVEKELTNTSCPPTVTHVPAQDAVPPSRGNPGREATPARDDRSPSNIDIAKTVIHIPNSARINLNEPGTIYPKLKYKDLWDADALEDRDINGDGTPDGVGDGIVWALPACPPDGTAGTDDLCIIFSAALLNSADWKEGSVIEYLLDHVHQIDIDKQDPRYTLAYNKDRRLLWDSSHVRIAEMGVAPGGYERPILFFTSRGTYELQVHIRGEPNHATDRDDGLKPVSLDDSVSSDMREYVIHVGAEANLGVTATATPDNPSPGKQVTVEITASNAGPDAAPDTSVDVTLPPGLTYASHVAPTGTDYASATGVWTIGELNKNASKTLTVTATVDAGTHGRELDVKAAISGTETVKITETDDRGNKSVKGYPVPVVDPDSSNDTAAVTVTVPTSHNTAPMFTVTRSIAENSAPGTEVGDPVGVKDPDSDDTLTFSLTGTGAHKFTASPVSGGAQIAVANGAHLDYEAKPSYDLTLGVSDGKDDDGNPDDTVDHTIGVLIDLEDVDETFRATLKVSNTSPNVGEDVTFTVAVQYPPAPIAGMHYAFVERTNGYDTERYGGTGHFGSDVRSKSAAGTYTYHMEYWHQRPDGTQEHRINSNTVTVTWSAP